MGNNGERERREWEWRRGEDWDREKRRDVKTYRNWNNQLKLISASSKRLKDETLDTLYSYIQTAGRRTQSEPVTFARNKKSIFKFCDLKAIIIAFDEGERIPILLLLAGSILMPSSVEQFLFAWNMSLDSMLLWPWWHGDQCRPFSNFIFLQLIVIRVIFNVLRLFTRLLSLFNCKCWHHVFCSCIFQLVLVVTN